MVADPTVAWLLTAIFAVSAAGYLHGARGRGRAADLRCAVDDALHVLMAVAMVAMLWWWGMAVPVMVYVLVFTAAMLWFVSRALFAGPGGVPAAGRGTGAMAWYHAAMMASMVFMAVVMSVAMDLSTVAPDTVASEPVNSGAGMAGMAVGGMQMSSVGAPAMPAEIWVWVPSLVLTLGFAAAAAWLVVIALRGRRGSLLFGATGGLMAVGMAAVFVQMV